MTTVELKNLLIHKITAINDDSFLKAINTIIDTKSKSTIYKTSEEQKEAINKSINQIDDGDYFTNEAVEAEIEKWLEED